ncbi:phosphoglycerate mutase-like protein [Westerdykella ornata]|uniref:Phosphoglycerate mutase-like protein n=1 Tax=Westerdykella ornata TaxID=318751 RepID=A0A6A6K105_WESOR|nr:phosphoglycerate mutase-like protein [Westerdykella ornata]KAF2281019.1 phosphoglycerate mutase-like protein [Westerdykella ornata]
MLPQSLLLASGLVLPAVGETVLGVTVFTRHGDRTSKHYPGYSLTPLGVQQNFRVGGDYRKRYIASNSPTQILGISENKVVNSQLFASAPDQSVLLNTATAFLQGLYPPLEELDSDIASQTINNGSSYANPLNGYQYVTLHGEESDSPDTVWLKGDEGCPAATASMERFEESAQFKEKEQSTKSFYQSFADALSGVYDYKPSDLSYKKAFDIFDLLNVASIHNASIPGNVTAEELFQLRTLADSAEFASNFDSSDAARSIGGKTFAGAVLRQLNQTVSSKGKLKFSFFAGSYDTFLAFFGISKLASVSDDFHGLPIYASTMSFELFTPQTVSEFPSNTDDLRVRFLFRNGSDGAVPLRAFPLFGRSEESLSWAEFVSFMKDIAITSAEQWCNTCQSELLFCNAYKAAGTSASSPGQKSMSNAVAGVIGAMVTLGVVSLLGAMAFILVRRRQAARREPAVIRRVSVNEKGSVYSDSASESA